MATNAARPPTTSHATYSSASTREHSAQTRLAPNRSLSFPRGTAVAKVMTPAMVSLVEILGRSDFGVFVFSPQDRLRLRQHCFLPVAAWNRDDDHLVRGNPWRQNQSAVVAVGHDHAADQPCRDAPRCAVNELHRLVARLELDVEHLREVLTQVVRGAGLNRTAVADHGFD